MIGITIGGRNQDARRRLRESPCGTEATLMTFTLEGGMHAISSGQTLRIWMPIRIRTRMSIFGVLCDGTTAATARNGHFGTSPYFWQLWRKRTCANIKNGMPIVKAQG